MDGAHFRLIQLALEFAHERSIEVFSYFAKFRESSIDSSLMTTVYQFLRSVHSTLLKVLCCDIQLCCYLLISRKDIYITPLYMSIR